MGVSTAGAVSARSAAEDGESSRMSEKAAERQAEIECSSFVTGVNEWAVVQVEQPLSPNAAALHRLRGAGGLTLVL